MTTIVVVIFAFLIFVYFVYPALKGRAPTAAGESAPPENYVRDESASLQAFYKSYADFAAETPEDVSRLVDYIENRAGLPRDGVAYPTELLELRAAARAFADGARNLFSFALELDDPEPLQLDQFANQHLIDPGLRPYFEGARRRSDSSEDYAEACEDVEVPREPLLYYAMGAFYGEWLVRHAGAAWTLYPPLKPIQSFPDMVTELSTICLNPFSHVTKKLSDPEGDQLAFKCEVALRSKRYLPPFPLLASLADSRQAARSLLPEQARAALDAEEAGRLEKALLLFSDVIASDPKDARLPALAIPVAWKLEKWEQVENWLHQVLDHYPDHPMMNHNLAVLYSGSPEGLPRAVALLEKALKVDPYYGRAHLTLASCLRDLGRKDEALQHTRWVQDHDPQLGPEAAELAREIQK